jgi:hypothetical protein
MKSTLGRSRFVPRTLAWTLAVSLLAGAAAPAASDTAGQISTRNIILGAVAVTAGIIIYNNYEHKVAQANTVVGYTPDGGTVYGDGRIVYPNSGGMIVYLSNNGSVRCAFDGYGVRCASPRLYAYFPYGYTPPCWPPGHCKQYWKQHPGEQGDDNDQGHGHGHGNGNSQ